MFDFRQTDLTRDEFQELALKHLDPLYAAALRLTKNDRDAEDLVQDAFLRAYRFFDKFERGTNIKAWLFKILTNTFINKYRKNIKERQVIDEVELDQGLLLSEESTRASRDPEGDLLRNMFSGDVQRALEALPEEFRVAVVLADLQDFSYKEIADIMECPVGTVMSRLYRGRRLLQARLRDYAEREGVIPRSSNTVTTEPSTPGGEGDSETVSLTDYRRRRGGTGQA